MSAVRVTQDSLEDEQFEEYDNEEEPSPTENTQGFVNIFDEIPFAIDVLSETANTEVGYTPALTTLENSFENTLKSNENFVSSQIDLIQDFKNKYYDETNTKIC